MRTFALLVLLWLTACSHVSPQRSVAFVAKKATEATLTFSHHVEMESATKPSATLAQAQVEAQLQHMFGPMERLPVMAAPKENHRARVTGVRPKEANGSVWLIDYDYEGTIVLEKGPRTKYRFPLPVNPDLIYEAGVVRGKNLCTDAHYQEEGDFWYFWAPAEVSADYARCPLRAGVDYLWVEGSVSRERAERRTTYPEYHRLADKNGRIDISFFYGMDDAAASYQDPYRSRDLGAESYRALAKTLAGMGVTLRRWSPAEVRRIADLPRGDRLPFVEEGALDYPSRGLQVRVRLFFGATGIDESSAGFHHFFRDGLRNSAVLVYDGHSGLGGHLDLEAISDRLGQPLVPNPSRYQIFFFNSCTSYTYYNTLYFNRKRDSRRGEKFDPKGTKNLDILANGLATSFDIAQETNFAIVRAIDLWARRGTWTSYRTLANRIDSDNLFTVNGDEDNPTEPVRN